MSLSLFPPILAKEIRFGSGVRSSGYSKVGFGGCCFAVHSELNGGGCSFARMGTGINLNLLIGSVGAHAGEFLSRQ